MYDIYQNLFVIFYNFFNVNNYSNFSLLLYKACRLTSIFFQFNL